VYIIKSIKKGLLQETQTPRSTEIIRLMKWQQVFFNVSLWKDHSFLLKRTHTNVQVGILGYNMLIAFLRKPVLCISGLLAW